MTADHGDNVVGRYQHQSDGESRFDLVVRGYDPRQVDEHIAGLERTISRQRTELEQARESGSRGAHHAAGGQDRASEGAGGLTPEMIGSFTTRLQSILQAAEEEAEEVRSNARNFARAEEEAGRARLAELERRRDGVVSDLSRVRSALDGLLSQVAGSKETPSGTKPPAEAASAARPDKAAARPEPGPRPEPGQRQPSPRPEPGPRVGSPLPVAEGNRPQPSPRQEEPAPAARPVPRQTPSPQGAGAPSPSPKPRPTPSPRPRTAPSPGVPSPGAPGRPVDQQQVRNGITGRENGTSTKRDDDGGRSAFGSGAR
jgi:syndecan 1